MNQFNKNTFNYSAKQWLACLLWFILWLKFVVLYLPIARITLPGYLVVLVEGMYYFGLGWLTGGVLGTGLKVCIVWFKVRSNRKDVQNWLMKAITESDNRPVTFIAQTKTGIATLSLTPQTDKLIFNSIGRFYAFDGRLSSLLFTESALGTPLYLESSSVFSIKTLTHISTALPANGKVCLALPMVSNDLIGMLFNSGYLKTGKDLQLVRSENISYGRALLKRASWMVAPPTEGSLPVHICKIWNKRDDSKLQVCAMLAVLLALPLGRPLSFLDSSLFTFKEERGEQA